MVRKEKYFYYVALLSIIKLETQPKKDPYNYRNHTFWCSLNFCIIDVASIYD